MGGGREGEREVQQHHYTITTCTSWQCTSELPGLQIMMSKQNILVALCVLFWNYNSWSLNSRVKNVHSLPHYYKNFNQKNYKNSSTQQSSQHTCTYYHQTTGILHYSCTIHVVHNHLKIPHFYDTKRRPLRHILRCICTWTLQVYYAAQCTCILLCTTLYYTTWGIYRVLFKVQSSVKLGGIPGKTGAMQLYITTTRLEWPHCLTTCSRVAHNQTKTCTCTCTCIWMYARHWALQSQCTYMYMYINIVLIHIIIVLKSYVYR